MVLRVDGSTPNFDIRDGEPAKNGQKVNQQNQDMPSVFGFKDNGNGIVDKEDFSDADMLKIAEEKGLIGKAWASITNLPEIFMKNKGEVSKQKEFIKDLLVNIESGKQIGTVQFGTVDPILGVNTNPVMNIQVKDSKVILTPFKHGQVGTPIEMSEEEFLQKCIDENGILNKAM